MTEGLIFNVMRFATHDGPGIRTTVFLKGCLLSCWWCHNPENRLDVSQVVYLPERCAGCGRCIQTCPAHALSRGGQGIHTDTNVCRQCSRCVTVCPMEARETTVWNVSVPGLMATIERDLPFFDQSGGGVTFSGGEPLCQPDFLWALLKECRRLDIHCAVDTSGCVDAEVLLKTAELTGLFLYDLKVLDPVKHRSGTGADNVTILSNLRLLSASGADITIRIPLIPGFNDTESDIAAAGTFISGLPQRHAVHLLPYHRAANAKYRKLGLCHRGEHIAPPSKEQMADAARLLARFGLEVGLGG